MAFRPWQRLVARVVLVAFTTAACGCGGSTADEVAVEASTTTTETTPPEETTTSVPPSTVPPTTLPAQAPERLGAAELRDLVAPVALYPDVVLASLLPATTFPEQLHEAAVLVGDSGHVATVPDDRGWDGSVVALLQFPDVVRWLDRNPAWTDQMGQAVAYQQGDVLDAIQDYRRTVKDAGNLKSNRYHTVRAEPDRDIRIEPARPDVVYVPSYDPVVATQPQPEPQQGGINPWLAFGGGALVGALGAWALYSIFDDDDDDDDHHHHHYYGRRRIRAYDNYYFVRGRRPRRVEWTPPARAVQPRTGEWRRVRRLEHVAAPAGSRTPVRAPRPPLTRPGAQAPRPADVRRLQRERGRQERQAERQDQRRAQEQRQAERRERRREQRQSQGQGMPAGREPGGRGTSQAERRQQQQEQRQERRAREQQREAERQQQRREQRQQRQEQREQRHEAEVERREQRQERRLEQRQERREQQVERQEQRRERREEKQQEKQQGRGDGGKKSNAKQRSQ